ncbi:hypothetical protein Mycsm_01784 [Mycobacterium sp. JS623]|nr:hypothetical protein Mycsm_01784 [Mycobacterium sp. JS623]
MTDKRIRRYGLAPLSLTLLGLAASTIAGCTSTDAGSAQPALSPSTPTVTCWDGSSGSSCPPLKGQAALEWLVPQRSSGPAPTCGKRLPTDYSPVETADELLVCTWRDSPGELTIKLYSSAAVAKSDCYQTDPWSKNGETYGRTGATESSVGQGGERWWCYDTTPVGITLVAPAPTFYELPDQLTFRTPDEIRGNGHS